jgi:hypothetical protein
MLLASEEFQVYLRNFCAMRGVAMVGPNVIIVVGFALWRGRLDKLLQAPDSFVPPGPQPPERSRKYSRTSKLYKIV